MIVNYFNNKLKKSLSNERIIKKEYGTLAKRINEVLDELDVAVCLDDIPEIPTDRRHKMTNEKYTWSIDVSINYRMWVQSDEKENDPTKVFSITILGIFDDH